MRVRAALSPIAGLLLLSTLSAFGWLLPDLLPHSLANRIPRPVGQALLFSLMAVLAWLAAVVRRRKFPSGRRAWAWGGIGVALFALPAGAAGFARGWVSNFDQVAVLCLTPVFALVLEPHLNHDPPRRPRAGLVGALAALAGILFLLPLEVPGSVRAGVTLLVFLITAVAVAAANCIVVRLVAGQPEESTTAAAAQAAGAAAICFAAAALLTHGSAWDANGLPIYLVRSFLIDVPALFLLFWLMRRMAASRITAHFLLTPLFASLFSLVLEQLLPSWRALSGLLLLAGGAGWLILAPDEDQTGQW